MAALCSVCSNTDESVEFLTIRDLFEHEKGGHVSRPPKPVKLPIKPVTPSLTEMRALAEGKPGDAASPIKPLEKSQTSIVIPLKLQYKWAGIHPACNAEVKTIEVDLGTKSMIIAYCVQCDTKLEQQEVIPIKLQGINENLPEAVDESSEKTFKEHMLTPVKKKQTRGS